MFPYFSLSNPVPPPVRPHADRTTDRATDRPTDSSLEFPPFIPTFQTFFFLPVLPSSRKSEGWCVRVWLSPSEPLLSFGSPLHNGRRIPSLNAGMESGRTDESTSRTRFHRKRQQSGLQLALPCDCLSMFNEEFLTENFDDVMVSCSTST